MQDTSPSDQQRLITAQSYEIRRLHNVLSEAVRLLDDSRCALADPALRRAWGRQRKLIRDSSYAPRSPLNSIFDVMDGQQWSPDTLDAIAEILTGDGYDIRPPA